MASYFDEHASTDRASHPNFLLELASAGFDNIGSPPASNEAINNLVVVTITRNHLKDDSTSSCPICLAEYEENEKVKQMPCEHMFHSGCILPWLEKTNSCPVCRYELPTDNEEYEELKKLKGKEEGRQHRVQTLHASMFS
ncbi:E3 ubiquitin-protein ligase RNF181-like [Actinia tenebrosa]|uniref:E3 ubiquitin-protein ligase RNF181 n=1 Tax=Actinia tenebrosa TaxID=6105 RepID=A0A6P8HJJ1_ACTTE|nr:E3 ubiquitin-protein ligase RNF181-like [Actinia tenebrosa]